jgi:hypothetical protein
MTEVDNDEARRWSSSARSLETALCDRDPIGTQISLNGLPYTVIGKVRKKDQDSNYTGPDNNRLFVPYETMRRDFPQSGPWIQLIRCRNHRHSL